MLLILLSIQVFRMLVPRVLLALGLHGAHGPSKRSIWAASTAILSELAVRMEYTGTIYATL